VEAVDVALALESEVDEVADELLFSPHAPNKRADVQNKSKCFLIMGFTFLGIQYNGRRITKCVSSRF